MKKTSTPTRQPCARPARWPVGVRVALTLAMTRRLHIVRPMPCRWLAVLLFAALAVLLPGRALAGGSPDAAADAPPICQPLTHTAAFPAPVILFAAPLGVDAPESASGLLVIVVATEDATPLAWALDTITARGPPLAGFQNSHSRCTTLIFTVHGAVGQGVTIYRQAGCSAFIYEFAEALPQYYLRARNYSAQDGRFSSNDKLEGNGTAMSSSGGYKYCSSNPQGRVDPSGRETLGMVMASIALSPQIQGSLMTLSAGVTVARSAVDLAAVIQAQQLLLLLFSSGDSEMIDMAIDLMAQGQELSRTLGKIESAMMIADMAMLAIGATAAIYRYGPYLLKGACSIYKKITGYFFGKSSAPAKYALHPGQVASAYPKGRRAAGGREGTRPNDPPVGIQEDEAWELTPENLKRMENGQPPLDISGKPIELHHRNQSPAGPLDEYTTVTHDTIPHPISPTQIDRNQFKGERRRYWVQRARELLGQD